MLKSQKNNLPFIPFNQNLVYKPSKCNQENKIDDIFCTDIYNKFPAKVRKEWNRIVRQENSYYFNNIFENYNNNIPQGIIDIHLEQINYYKYVLDVIHFHFTQFIKNNKNESKITFNKIITSYNKMENLLISRIKNLEKLYQ